MNPILVYCSKCYAVPSAKTKDLPFFMHSCGDVFCQKCTNLNGKCRSCTSTNCSRKMISNSSSVAYLFKASSEDTRPIEKAIDFQYHRCGDYFKSSTARLNTNEQAIRSMKERCSKVEALERENGQLRAKVSELKENIKKVSPQPAYQIDDSSLARGNDSFVKKVMKSIREPNSPPPFSFPQMSPNNSFSRNQVPQDNFNFDNQVGIKSRSSRYDTERIAAFPTPNTPNASEQISLKNFRFDRLKKSPSALSRVSKYHHRR